MKNLKKLLAMALVIAMAFGLMATVGAVGLEDYSDVDDITYEEPVDLFTQLGILAGMGDGTFSPTGLVTREQAAKIICYMLLGSSKADALRTASSSFTDVALTRWSAAYIEYCVSRNIIDGMGDGTFVPEGNVTGTQFAKLLLTALGYGKKDEYVGADWELSVIGDASTLGILSLNVDVSAPATREEVAQYAFNAYTDNDCYTVVYSKDLDAYLAATATYSTTRGTLADQQYVYPVKDIVINGITYYQWYKAEDYYGGTYRNARPVSALYPVDQNVFTSTDGTALSRLTNPSNTKYQASLSSNPSYYLNGAPSSETVCENFSKIRGVIVNLINTNTDPFIETVSIINKAVHKLSAAPIVNDARGTVTILGICDNYKASFVDGYEGLAAGDWVLWYTDNTSNIHIEKAQSVTGQMTKWEYIPAASTYAMTFGDELYFNSGLTGAAYGGQAIDNFAGMPGSFNADATAWLDNGGNVIFIALNAAPAASTFGIVLDYMYYGGLVNTAKAKVFLGDGTVGIYDVAPGNDSFVPNQTDKFSVAGTYGYLVGYTLNANGQITLNTAGVSNDTLQNAYSARSNFIDGANADFTLTNSTQVFYFDSTKPYNNNPNSTGYNPISTLTGFDKTRGVTAEKAFNYISAPYAQYIVAAVMFVDKTIIPISSNYAFRATTNVINRFENGIHYYDYVCYVGGERTVLTSRSPDLFTERVDGSSGSVGEWTDLDNDGTIDTDEWNDANGNKIFETGEWNDANGDKIFDTGEWNDANGDKIFDTGEWNDANGNKIFDTNEWIDINGDGKFTENEWFDHDHDDVKDFGEWTDTNADGIADLGEWTDTNGDGIADLGEWTDTNGDGKADLGEWTDTNKDGKADLGEWNDLNDNNILDMTIAATGLYYFETDANGYVTYTSDETSLEPAPNLTAYKGPGNSFDKFMGTYFTFSGGSVPVDSNTRFYRITYAGAYITGLYEVEGYLVAAGSDIDYIVTTPSGVAVEVYFK